MSVASPTLFLRNATGLVRDWSVFDAFIYSSMSINLVTLGWYGFAFAPFIVGGNLLWAVVISGAILLFQVATYAQLISVMPRAGGDYVWQSRVLFGGVGFVLGITGYVFTLWQWAPIYGNILAVEVFAPLFAVLARITGSATMASWSTSFGVYDAGNIGWPIFLSSLITLALVAIFISLGMRWYARIQKVSFWIGLAGLATVALIFLITESSTFRVAFNAFAQSVYGVKGDAYAATLAAATKNGLPTTPMGSLDLGPTMAVVPFMLFFNLWAVWGATLYGEVRGASDLRRNFTGMASSLVITSVMAVLFFLLAARAVGWDFYNAANGAWAFGNGGIPVFPYPGLMAAIMVNNPIVQLWIIVSLSFWFWGWCGTLFMTSTRVIFAASFDRILPAWAADINERWRTPLKALMIMILPAIVVSYLYSFTSWFPPLILDATVMIAVMYLGTAVAAVLLPYRRPELFKASTIADLKVLGIPLISITGAIFGIFLLGICIYWITNATYGVNNRNSAIYLGVLLLIAVGLYVGARVYQKRRGVDITLIHREIPVE